MRGHAFCTDQHERLLFAFEIGLTAGLPIKGVRTCAPVGDTG